jgi:hypothetical protein
MLDLTEPQIRQAYLLGVETGKASANQDSDRAAEATENRIISELERYRVRLKKENPKMAEHIAVCIAIIKGEVY